MLVPPLLGYPLEDKDPAKQTLILRQIFDYYRVCQLSFHPSLLKFAPPKMSQNYMKYIIDYDLQHYESF